MMKKILIVDDSNMSRRMMRRILESAGYELIEAADGFSALEQYSLDKPDLVMLDLTMEGMHGLELLTNLRQMHPEVRAIVATADIQSTTRQLALEGGAAAFIAKPFEEKTVLDTVKKVLEES
jgi:two-component system, chemotaxis family, chemotaxis protein CheY